MTRRRGSSLVRTRGGKPWSISSSSFRGWRESRRRRRQQGSHLLQHVHPPSSRPSTASDPLSNMPFLDLPTPLPRPGQEPAPGMHSSLNSTSLGLATSPTLHRGWRPPKMAPLEEHEDVEHYLTTFERLATACQWPLETWVLCPC
jgi:hypothetical protein